MDLIRYWILVTLFIALLSCNGCVYTEEGLLNREFYLQPNEGSVIRLNISTGSLEEMKILGKRIVKMQVDELRGGKTFLFGLIKVVDLGVMNYKIIEAEDRSGKLTAYSINDILKMKTYTIDSKEVFLLN